MKITPFLALFIAATTFGADITTQDTFTYDWNKDGHIDNLKVQANESDEYAKDLVIYMSRVNMDMIEVDKAVNLSGFFNTNLINDVTVNSDNGNIKISATQDTTRDQFNRTLSITFRDGKFLIAGFTYSALDSTTGDSEQSCDLNFLTKKGTYTEGTGKKQDVELNTGAFELSSWVDDEKYTECSAWIKK